MLGGFVKASLADFCPAEGRKSKGSSDSTSNEEDKEFKSKNLKAERKRRQKLSERLLELRSVVPNITNMTKATIITDAITYIEKLQTTVKDLSAQLCQLDANLDDCPVVQKSEKIGAAEEMSTWATTPEIEVIHLNGDKLWIQIVYPKKRGGFSKLVEAITALGFHVKDINVTTSKGVYLVTSCVEGDRRGYTTEDQIRTFLLETIRST